MHLENLFFCVETPTKRCNNLVEMSRRISHNSPLVGRKVNNKQINNNNNNDTDNHKNLWQTNFIKKDMVGNGPVAHVSVCLCFHVDCPVSYEFDGFYSFLLDLPLVGLCIFISASVTVSTIKLNIFFWFGQICYHQIDVFFFFYF